MLLKPWASPGPVPSRDEPLGGVGSFRERRYIVSATTGTIPSSNHMLTTVGEGEKRRTTASYSTLRRKELDRPRSLLDRSGLHAVGGLERLVSAFGLAAVGPFDRFDTAEVLVDREGELRCVDRVVEEPFVGDGDDRCASGLFDMRDGAEFGR